MFIFVYAHATSKLENKPLTAAAVELVASHGRLLVSLHWMYRKYQANAHSKFEVNRKKIRDGASEVINFHVYVFCIFVRCFKF